MSQKTPVRLQSKFFQAVTELGPISDTGQLCSPEDPNYRDRFPGEIISYCVWLYFRMTFSVRDVKEIMAMRGISVTYEAIRKWSLKFGQQYANQLRQRRPRPGGK